MAVDAVLDEPVSGQFPAIREIYREFRKMERCRALRGPRYLIEPVHLTGARVKLVTQNNRELNLTYQGIVFA